MKIIKKIKWIMIYSACVISHSLFAQIYPTEFLLNGCSYTYKGLAFESGDTLHFKNDNYVLVFEDDFDGDTLDTNNWQTYFPWGRALHNSSSGTGFAREYMKDENATVSAGYLHLTTKIDPGTRDIYDIPFYDPSWLPPHNSIYSKYTSGMIYSKSRFKFGKFEIRAKIPLIDGTWPSFWLFGDCGQEIDVFELTNVSLTSDADTDSKNMIMSYHKQNYCHVESGGQCDNGFTRNVNVNLSDDFHVYSVEWNANKIIWKLDSVIVREVYRIWKISPPLPFGPLYGYAAPVKQSSEINNFSSYATFNAFPTEDNYMNIILGTGIAYDRGIYPKEYTVDYVKVYSDTTSKIQTTNLNVSDLKIYPNPSNGVFSVCQSKKDNPIINIKIINTLGETVQNYIVVDANSFNIDISNQSKGIYFVKIACKEKTYITKIICN